MSSEISFRARMQDLSKAVRLISANRKDAKESDFVDFLVSECIATIRSVGTSTEIPVAGSVVGAARLPFPIFEKMGSIARSFGKNETDVTIAEGVLKISSWRHKADGITVGAIPDQRIDLPVNASCVDTLALAHFLSAEQIVMQGLHHRVALAREIASDAVAKAELALHPLSISRQQIEDLIEAHIAATSRTLLKAIGREK